MRRRVVFSDIDGTLVHYPDIQDKYGKAQPCEDSRYQIYIPHDLGADDEPHMLLKLPQSATGLQGVISLDTLSMVQHLRNNGHRFVLVTGARTRTAIQRMPYLPMVDAFVMENGGRIMILDHREDDNLPLLPTTTMPDNATTTITTCHHVTTEMG